MSKAIAAFLLAASLHGCISYEPRVLTPNITLSPEAISFSQTEPNSGAMDFGFQASVNESDSLFNVEVLPGVRIGSIEAGGPAAMAGLQVGDIVLSIDGVETNHPDAVAALQQQSSNTLDFLFRARRGTTVFEAKLAARPITASVPPTELFRVDPVATRAGYSTEVLQINGRSNIVAARVEEIYPKSPLPAAGIGLGDVIIGLDGSELNSAQDLITRLNQDYSLGSQVMFTVFSAGELREVSFDLWNPGRRISQVSVGPLLNYSADLSPQSTRFTLLNLWLFSLYSYDQNQGEKSHSILGLINFSSDLGELVEE